MKIKHSKLPGSPNAPPSDPPTPSAQTPGPGSAISSGGFKLKLKSAQPPTPGAHAPRSQLSQPTVPTVPTSSQIPKKVTKKPKTTDDKKRPADDDISPAPKRPTINTATKSKISLKFGGNTSAPPSATTPASAKLKLSARKQSIGPKSLTLITNKRPPPKRPVGVGYDSEASDAEDDPAVESQFVLRMEPGQDCDTLREAIANKTLGEKPENGGPHVNIKFIDRDARRALVNINHNLYAAVMVDLPCIIEGMKSWDKRGWWKVADICQMLLVLGRTPDEASARTAPLPREVDKHTYAYAHGLTPPMHWVRKRRFRKRASYKSVEHVDEEVERLLKADELAEKSGGSVRYDVNDQDATDAQTQPDQDEYYDDEPPEYVDSTEDPFGQAMAAELENYDNYENPPEDPDAGDLEDMLRAGLDVEEDLHDAPPLPPADAAASFGAVQTAIAEAEAITEDQTSTPTAETPAPVDEGSSEEDESDEDEDDEPSPDTIDEEQIAKQQQQAQVMEEIEDLQKEVENARANVERTNNPMLRQRNINKLRSLESELAMKRRNFGLEVDGEDEE